MDCPTGNAERDRADGLVRLICFVLLATVGMGSIGMAVLAGPLVGHYADRAVIRGQQERIVRLRKLYEQPGELLCNAQTPSVVARLAISKLNYVPVESDCEGLGELPAVWPDLQRALGKIDQEEPLLDSSDSQQFMERLSQNRASKILLTLCGGALVVLSMACFNRPR